MSQRLLLCINLTVILAASGCDGGGETGTGGGGMSTGGTSTGGTGGAGGGGTGGSAGPCATVTCQENAHCEVQGADGVCVCDPGFEESGGACNDIDECQNGTAMCPDGVDCKNVPGTYACACDPGYVWDGKACALAGIRTLDAGTTHACRVEPDGHLSCWGYLAMPSPSLPEGHRESSPAVVGADTDWVSVAAAGLVSNAYTCGIKKSGALLCWGKLPVQNYIDTPTEIAPGTTWTSIDVAESHGCGVRTDGTLWCFGNNGYSELGVPGVLFSPSPVQVGADTDWVLATTGDLHSCALKKSGEAYCWGINQYGEVGDGTQQKRDAPVPVDGGAAWSMINAGSSSTCGVRLDGTLRCWGSGVYGQLGVDPPQAQALTPIQVGTDSDLRTVDAGSRFACAVHHKGTLECWGMLFGTVLGDPLKPSAAHSPTPFEIASVGAVDRITLSSDGISADGFVCAAGPQGMWCWGRNEHGQLGIGAFGNKVAPTKVGSDSWKSVTGGLYRTCSIHADGGLFCWGGGQAGNVQTPTQVGALTTWKSVHLGATHQCALGQDGGLSCWGYGFDGELGLGPATQEAAEPTPVGADKDWLAVACGDNHTCGIRAGGALYCWGSNSYGAVGDGGSGDAYSPVQIGAGMTWSAVAAAAGTCAITSGGALWCWGGKLFGAVPEQVGADTDWLAVSLGSQGKERVCGIRAPGTLHCLGDGLLGDGTDDPSGVPVQAGAATDWKTIELGPGVSCGMLADNSLRCWGPDFGGLALGVYDAALTPVQVDAGSSIDGLGLADSHICVHRPDQSIACWGAGWLGQLGHGDAWRTEPTKAD